jgi:acyl transferase domain-containing protein
MTKDYHSAGVAYENLNGLMHEPGIHNTPVISHTNAITVSESASSINGNQGISPDAIAICGIGLRLPGGIRTPHQLWNFLVSGKDARSPIPPSRWNPSGWDDSLGSILPIWTKHGYFLDEDLSCLDTSFFSMTKAEAERCDPQQRIMLEVVRECLEDAGEVNYRGERVACYVGNSGEDWLRMGARDPYYNGG